MRIDDLLDTNDGVIRLADHPHSERTIQRAAVSGRVVALLPGVFVSPDRVGKASTRIRAVCAWSSDGTIHGHTAAQLHLRRPVSEPICLKATWRGQPPGWLRVTIGTVAHPLHDSGLRVSTLAHAVVELAATDRGEAAFEALRRRLLTPEQLLDVLPEFQGSSGNVARRAAIRTAARNPWSYGEVLLHDLVVRADVGPWVANQPVWTRGRLVAPDVRLVDHDLVLEFDGEAVHSTHEQFEDDRRRQNLLVLGRLRVLRFTWEMVTQHPEEVVAMIRAAAAMS